MTHTHTLLERRRGIARKIGDALAGHPDVTAVYVLGSVASGHVDERSDVDVSFVCRAELLPLEERRRLLSPIGPDWRFDQPASDDPVWSGNAMPAQEDEGVVDGVPVQIIYQSATDISQVVDEVVNLGAITTSRVPDRPYTLIGMLRRAWLLSDKDGLFRGWMEQTATFPDLLRRNILRASLPILRENAGELKEYAERRLGPSLFIFFLTRADDALHSILYALNDVYDPAEKRAECTILPTLRNVPRDFLARYSYVLQGPFDDSGAMERARLFAELADEALSMGEAQME